MSSEKQDISAHALTVRNGSAGKESCVITVKNYESTDMKLRHRKPTKSHFESFTRDGLGQAPRWKTSTISGYIQDFNIGDFDNDGQDELFAAVILEEGNAILVTEPKSTIIAVELSMSEKPEL